MTTQTQHALPTGTWKPDPVHSAIGFAVDYMAGTFQGAFTDFDASVADGVVRGSAEVASVQVKDENLEAHLQSPDYFDAERNPQLTFESRATPRRSRSEAGSRTLSRTRSATSASGCGSRPRSTARGTA
jgi:polyisoprenoid-binding protein YceI